MTDIARAALSTFGPNAVDRRIDVLDSHVHWVEVSGDGDPVVFLHGNPTSSFLWRKVIAGWNGRGRLLAPDLIGFGDSGKPDIEYTLEDHERYLDAWFDSLELTNVVLVLQDYGSTFGLSWARKNPDRVKAVALLEPIIRPIPSAALDPNFVALRARVLSEEGEQIVLRDNFFVEQLLPGNVLDGLTDDEKAEYVRPFPTVESRKPVLVFPRALPVDGEPAGTVEVLALNEKWLTTSATPKILFTFDPGFLLTEDILEWATTNIESLEVEHLGAGNHYVQEDRPTEIADAVTKWLAALSQ